MTEGSGGIPTRQELLNRAKRYINLWDHTFCVEIEILTGMNDAREAYYAAPDLVRELVAEVERSGSGPSPHVIDYLPAAQGPVVSVDEVAEALWIADDPWTTLNAFDPAVQWLWADADDLGREVYRQKAKIVIEQLGLKLTDLDDAVIGAVNVLRDHGIDGAAYEKLIALLGQCRHEASGRECFDDWCPVHGANRGTRI